MRHNLISSFLISSLAALLSCSAGLAKQPFTPEASDPNLEDWRWTEYSHFDGKRITCMTEYPAEVYWFGGADVTIRYDGYRYQEFGAQHGLQGTKVLCFARHPTLGLLAGTNQGLFRWSSEKWQAIVSSHTPQKIQARNIVVLEDQSILVALSELEESPESSQRWHGLLHVTEERIQLYSREPPAGLDEILLTKPFRHVPVPEDSCIMMDGQLRFNVTSVTQAKDGSIWTSISQNNRAGNRAVRYAYSPETHVLSLDRVFKSPDGPETESFTSIIETDEGEIWITSNNSTIGIAQWNGERWKQQRLSEFFPGNEAFYYMIKTSDGAVWVDGSGKYFRYKDGQWARYSFPTIPITLSNRINFFEASDGAIWIIATNSRLFRLDYASKPWNLRKRLAFQLETADKSLWFLSEDGRLVQNQAEQWNSFGVEDGIIDTPLRLFLSSQNELWAIGSHRGHAALSHSADQRHWETIEYPDLSWSFDHRAAFEDKDGAIYFASAVDTPPHQETGLVRFNNPTTDKSDWTRMGTNTQFPTKQSYYGIGQSPDSRIWLGGRPVVTLRNGVQSIAAEIPESDVFVDYIFNQPNGNLWLVTRDRGMLEIASNESRWHNVESGLPSHSIVSGYAHSSNDVWIALNDQIARYDGKSWSTFFKPKDKRYARGTVTFGPDSTGTMHISQVSNYWLRRGYPGNKYTPDLSPFNTLSYYDDRKAPIVKITHFEPKVGPPGNTSVTWSGTDFLERTPREQLEYSYKINDAPWSPFSKESAKRLLGLAPGEYKIEVRSRNRGFNISPEHASAVFAVAAPTWQQLWFQATIATLLALVAFFLYQTIQRSRSLSKLNSKLLQSNKQLNEQQEIIATQNRALRSQHTELENRVKERTEDLEKAKLKAEESDRLKTAFLANVSHEIRTPMNAIIGFSELLSYAPQQSEENRSFIKTIQNSGKDLLNLIDDIIEVSKLESEPVELAEEDVLVNWILTQTQDTFRGVLTRLGKENLNLIVDTKELPEGCTLRTDPARLKQVLKNLLSNAVKFTPDGYILLRCRPTNDGKSLEFSVEDSGFGIKKEQLCLIFERFRKADTNKGHTHRGSGLGLPISQNLIAKLGGKIEVESELGKGSRFYFSLPWDGRVDQQATEDTPAAEPEDSSRTVPLYPLLVVEDEAANVDLISKMLERLQFPYIHVTSAERAIDLCQQTKFSAVLMDIKLPEMQGDEAARKIREIAPTLPIISQTAYAMAGERERYSQEPFTAYLSKPLTYSSLAATLNAVLGS
ncbi:ATP-binding protein [Pelagicoccus enzymogenes]|uniref:ATP-binding protein n=1 Tax=Pelagicoccus enzymogenes TaxID=2773457 RepID=UPI00280C7420|nr:ATP-binding protein [Pelagicoccus enzymogenes]MDQ8200446.1 ATP-binding protein [Pelagicoccus enzymogenes]